MQFFKRILLFVFTNLAIVVTLTLLWAVLSYFFPQLSQFSSFSLILYAGVFGFAGALISLAMSRTIAKMMYRIQLIESATLHQYDEKTRMVYETVAQIAQEHQIHMPEVGIYDAQDPNAFATGPSRNKSLVAVSQGLIDTMASREIKGVVAHEMAHVLNGDMVTMTLLQGLVNTFVILASHLIARFVTSLLRRDDSEGAGAHGMLYYLVVHISELLLGILGMVVVFAFSRFREYRADAGGARYVGRDTMLSALKALQKLAHHSISTSQRAPASLETLQIAHATGKPGWRQWFSTHPDIADRIARLESETLILS